MSSEYAEGVGTSRAARLLAGGLVSLVNGWYLAIYECKSGGGKLPFIRHSDSYYGAVISNKDLRGFQTEKAQGATWYAVAHKGGFLCFYVPIHGSR